jgi:DinB superfamily
MDISWDKVNQELQDIRKRTEQLIQGLSSEDLTRRPESGGWSIAECIGHLNVTAATIQPLIDSALKQGKDKKIVGKGPFQPGTLGRLFLWIAEPPPKFKLKAPKAIAPAVSGDPSQVITEFMRFQDGWARLVKEADGLDLNKIKVKTFPGLPAMRIGASVPWMMAHQRRHLWQAEGVKEKCFKRSEA